MKTIILAGGFGTRLSEETDIKPKPMIEIGGKPMIWHIMNSYDMYGYKEFVVALGYKGEIIKKYFIDYPKVQNDLTINLKTGELITQDKCIQEWIVHLIDTGAKTMTGGRLLRLKHKLKGQPFMMTYGDGLSNVNIQELIKFHKSHNRIATVTVVRPIGRFGAISFKNDVVMDFEEKSKVKEGWINGGFFIFEPEIFDYLKDDMDVLEGEPMNKLVRDKQLMAYKHEGFWQCMDTLRDKRTLEELWQRGSIPWINKDRL